MDLIFALSKAVDAILVQINANGSGVIEVPILTATSIDFSKTSGGGPKDAEITKKHLVQMVSNFTMYPGPVPVGVSPHVEYDDRHGASPAFVEALKIKGDTLYAQIFLIAPLMREFMDGVWRGFSIEAALDLETPTVNLVGWALTGGVFTNRPATDVHFRPPMEAIAAGAQQSGQAFGVVQLSLRTPQEKEQDMTKEEEAAAAKAKAEADEKARLEADRNKRGDTVSLSFHESTVSSVKAELSTANSMIMTRNAELASAKTRIESLEKANADKSEDLRLSRQATVEAQSAEATAKGAKLEAEGRANRLQVEYDVVSGQVHKMGVELTELRSKLSDVSRETVNTRMRAMINAAIDKGVPPAQFDGYESDPQAWLKVNFASLEAFEKHCGRLAGSAIRLESSATRSGHDSTTDGEESGDSKARDEKLVKELEEKAGIKSRTFGNITNAKEAQKAFEAKKQKEAEAGK